MSGFKISKATKPFDRMKFTFKQEKYKQNCYSWNVLGVAEPSIFISCFQSVGPDVCEF